MSLLLGYLDSIPTFLSPVDCLPPDHIWIVILLLDLNFLHTSS
jgi:hypothetical protein